MDPNVIAVICFVEPTAEQKAAAAGKIPTLEKAKKSATRKQTKNASGKVGGRIIRKVRARVTFLGFLTFEEFIFYRLASNMSATYYHLFLPCKLRFETFVRGGCSLLEV
jgi:hypothetical protein